MSTARNRLADAASPYLRQHADNPVDWYPWGEEAFAKARAEGKPIFLSIGYSTCHWCHVMAHESFADPAVAKLLNDHYVAIKVDREERPDVDHVYMMVTQAMTGSGGWPMTVFLTPDLKPFYAGTYFPKEDRLGRPGMLRLLPAIAEAWEKDRDGLLHTAGEIEEYLRQQSAGAEPGDVPGADTLAHAVDSLRGSYDREFGGFGRAPKFPTPHQLTFLLRHWHRYGDADVLDMVTATLTAMHRGGIYDQVGFGFHRYSTDRQWLVPHFEKMLYDQALLVLAALETYQATRRQPYAGLARDVLHYVHRDLTGPHGAFTSAEDADSEGVEGKFYLWTPAQLRDVLGAEDAELAARAWNITAEQHIPHLTADPPPELDAIRRQLFAARDQRVHPFKDEKVLTDWNGLMIAAFARAAVVLNAPEYAGIAEAAADFILTELRGPDGRLRKRWYAGAADLPAHLDDHAFLAWGLFELYEATFDVRWLAAAVEFAETLVHRYRDRDSGAFFMTAADAEPLLVRARTAADGALPSGNAVAADVLLRLAYVTSRPDLEQVGLGVLRAYARSLRQQPTAHTQLLHALDLAIGPSAEIVIAGPDPAPFLDALRACYLPRCVRLFRPPRAGDLARIAPYIEAVHPLDGRTAAYVCQDFTCQQPTTDPEQMLARIRAGLSAARRTSR